jgi:hypothetical protein
MLPTLHPRVAAAASTLWSSQYRSTSTARMRGGILASASSMVSFRSDEWSGAVWSGTAAMTRSHLPRLRYSAMYSFSSTRRA